MWKWRPAGWLLSGATDAGGKVRFEGVAAGGDYPRRPYDGDRYVVQAYVPGKAPLDLRGIRSVSDIPPDDALRGREGFVPRYLRTIPDKEVTTVMPLESIGFIRGKVLDAPAVDRAREERFGVGVYGGRDMDERPAGVTMKFFAETGDFIAGPFGAGEVELRLSGTHFGESRQRVTVKAGEVTRVELRTVKKVGVDAAAHPFLDGDGRMNATVLLADGKTPAAGAVVECYHPGRKYPSIRAVADGAGHLTAGMLKEPWGASWVPVDPAETREPAGYMMVAWLPGVTGRVVTPVDESKPLSALAAPLRMVLPASVKAHGRVTLAGARFPVNGHVRLLAAYSGKGRLNGPLSVETLAQANGTFDLAGLTPGRYRVQAALDDLWFSETVELEVTDRPPAPLDLEIAAPGTPMVLKIGRVKEAVSISRPSGPLVEQLGGSEFVSDGAGRVYVPTVEAGEHMIAVGGRRLPVSVPRVSAENSAQVREIEAGY